MKRHCDDGRCWMKEKEEGFMVVVAEGKKWWWAWRVSCEAPRLCRLVRRGVYWGSSRREVWRGREAFPRFGVVRRMAG